MAQQQAPRPLMPTLSASNKSGRPPLTPRIAGSVNGGTPPTSRRTGTAQVDPTTLMSKASGASAREEISTPVKAFLSSNITPRSSSRKARVDSPTSTPTGTPNTGTPGNTRPTSAEEHVARAAQTPASGAGLGIGGLQGEGNNAGEEASPMFFFASDAKASPNAARPPTAARPVLQPSPSTFFYASDQNSPATSPLGPQQKTSQGKFFHAISPPGGQPIPLSSPSGRTPVTTTATSRPVLSPRTAQAGSNASARPQPRPLSPQKMSQGPTSAPWRGKPPQAPQAQAQAQAQRPSQGRPQSPMGSTSGSAVASPLRAQPNWIVAGRRTSMETPASPVGHDRSLSNGSVSSGISLRADSIEPPSPEPRQLASPSEDLAQAEDVPKPDESAPGTPGGSKVQQMNELAANARRERKVLDLEISNSSLLAINRTLEREMRKQTAELRRFRRLSRSGRLSLSSSTPGGRRVSSGGRHSLQSIHDDGSDLSDVAENPASSDEDDVTESSDSDEDSPDDSSLSPTARAASDARHMARDEKRLQLDLQKHQQLLVDSQKMNQSLKRCLGWTEQLIVDGKRALSYKVRVSEVELGGRVLVGDEDDQDEGGEAEAGIGGAGPWGTVRFQSATALTDETFEMGAEMEKESERDGGDRDSGIEVEAVEKEAG